MFQKKYLTETHLKGFDKYKYNCVDSSIFSRKVMHPSWNFMVKIFPMWLAPNLITFVGFLLTVCNFFLFSYYDYGFYAATHNPDGNPIPLWVYLVCGVTIFVAYNLDGMDGKQARRTGSSTPLGELFDHGLDSYSTFFIAVYLFSLFGRGDFTPIRMHLMTICVYTNFYLTHFEKYNTGVMFLPWGYDFLMWGLTFLLIIAYICGPAIWTNLMFGWKPTHILELVLYSSATITSWPVIAYNIYKSYRDKTGKMRTFKEAARPLYPLLALFFVSSVWAFGSNNNIVEVDPRMFFVLSGTIFSNICCRLIVAQMSDTRTDGWNFQLTLLSFATFVCVLPYRHLNLPELALTFEKVVLYTLVSAVTILHLHYGVGVVQEMCRHLKIRCFKVRPITSSTKIHGIKHESACDAPLKLS